jgi:hypothetical protein
LQLRHWLDVEHYRLADRPRYGVRRCASHTLTNQYGIFIDDIDDGGTLNYAIYTGLGLVRFGDDVRLLNDNWLTFRNQAGSADIQVLSVDTNDDTVLAADASDQILFKIATQTYLTLGATGTFTVEGTLDMNTADIYLDTGYAVRDSGTTNSAFLPRPAADYTLIRGQGNVIVQIDSDAGASTNVFQVRHDATTHTGGTLLLEVHETTGLSWGGGGKIASSDDVGAVKISGTPVDNQIAIWTNATTIEGDSGLTWSGTQLTTTGDIWMSDTAGTKGLSFDSAGPDGVGVKRIVWNDGATNFAIRSHNYFSGGNEVYTATGTGPSSIEFLGDSAAGKIDLFVAATGTVGGTITWDKQYTFATTGLSWGSVGQTIADSSDIWTGCNAGETIGESSSARNLLQGDGASGWTALGVGTSLQFLRVNVGATDLEWHTLTAGDISGILDASGTPLANQVAFWVDTDTLTHDADFTWDGDLLKLGASSGTQGGIVLYGNTSNITIDMQLASSEDHYIRYGGNTAFFGFDANVGPEWYTTDASNWPIIIRPEEGEGTLFIYADHVRHIGDGNYYILAHSTGAGEHAAGLHVRQGTNDEFRIARMAADTMAWEANILTIDLETPATTLSGKLTVQGDIELGTDNTHRIMSGGADILFVDTSDNTIFNAQTGNQAIWAINSVAYLFLDDTTSQIGFIHRPPIVVDEYYCNTTVSLGDVLFLDYDSGSVRAEWYLADADLAAFTAHKIPFVGVAMEAGTANNLIKVAVHGAVTTVGGSSNWGVAQAGQPVYVDTTAGDANDVAPTAAGSVVMVLGFVIDSSTIYIQPHYVGKN